MFKLKQRLDILKSTAVSQYCSISYIILITYLPIINGQLMPVCSVYVQIYFKESENTINEGYQIFYIIQLLLIIYNLISDYGLKLT